MLYINDRSVIVGKHQNTLNEINYQFVKENEIKVVRRLSGGGAVYHDLGNLNFTFIRRNQNENLVDFRKHMQPIAGVLKVLGLSVEIANKNDLTIDGKKISGNAEHVYKNKVLHHGTLLFSTDLPNLSMALEADHLKYIDNAVKSIKSEVENISVHLKSDIGINQFAGMIMKHIFKNCNDCKNYQLTDKDIKEIQRLVENKYSSWEWNFGYSPSYIFKNKMNLTNANIEISIGVEKGLIKDIMLSSDLVTIKDASIISNALTGCRHEEQSLLNKLKGLKQVFSSDKIFIEDLVNAMF